MANTFYLVWTPSTGYTAFKHENYSAAKEEAKRLASINHGKEFYVLATMAKAVRNDIQFEEFYQDPSFIPF